MLGMEDIFSEPYSWIVGLFVFIISYMYISKEPWKGLPPGPPRLPLVGSLPFLGADMRKPLKKMADKYGNIFTVYLGPQRVVVLKGYDVIKEAFSTKGHVFSGRPAGFYNEEITKGHGLIFNQGPMWVEQRSYVHRVLKDFGFGRNMVESRILDEVEHFVKALENHGTKPLNPLEVTKKSIANVICSVLLGRRFEYEDDTFNGLIQCLEKWVAVMGTSNITNIFSWLRYLPGDMFGLKEFVSLTNNMLDIYRGFIHTRKGHHNFGQQDFIQVYLRKIEQEKENPSSTFTERQLLFILHELFGAGVDTTSDTLMWMIVYMVLNQDIQSRVHTEIDDVIGIGEMPRLEHREALPFTEACIAEVQRIRVINPLGLPHGTTDETTLGGYTIPRDTMVIPLIQELHMDRDIWAKPEIFEPCHFLDTEGRFVRRKECLPFGIGKRMCPAESMARMELFLYFTTMMKNFRLLPAPGYSLPDVEGIFTLTNRPKPFHVKVEKRH